VLEGLGVALALPWLEGLEPPAARAQAGPARRRFVTMFFPNGTALYWRPQGQGAGAAWRLSPILEPLEPLKSRVTVLTNLENYSHFGTGLGVEPSHAQLAGAFLTCTKCAAGNVARNGTSADQVIARHVGAATPFPSLQVGLSTTESSPDGRHPANSRSVSWASPTEPLYKTVNPQALFDRLVSASPAPGQDAEDPQAARRRALRKSALDYVLENATALQKQLGASDRARLDQFTTSVRELERRVQAVGPRVRAACARPPRPAQAYAVGQMPADYNRNTHAEIMIDLVAMALACDLTRVVSFMLDDERSDFSYNFLAARRFTAAGSTPDRGRVGGGYHGIQHAGETNNAFATITHWNVEKLAQLCTKLAAVQDGDGTLLDSSVVYFASSMRGGDHRGNDLPVLYVGSGGGALRTDHHVHFGQERPLADLYITFIQRVFRLAEPSFANSRGVIGEIVA
jgi:hypothetical protein